MHVVKTLLEVEIDDVVVVLGHEKEAVLDASEKSALAARVVVNDGYAAGQLSSLQSGLRVVDRPGVVATLVTLVDVPFVSAATARAVIDRYRRTHAPIVRPARGGRHGHPLLIDRSLFGELRRADPAGGARLIVRAHATTVGDVELDDDGAFMDIDTPDEYERALKIFNREAGGASTEAGKP